MIALTSYWGLDAAVREFRPNKLISLMDPPCNLATPVGIDAANHLRLALHDIVLRIPFATRPEVVHIEQLLAFGNDWLLPQRLLVHCAAGISRSSAALILLLVQKNHAREQQVVGLVRERAQHILPNRRLIQLGDHALGCEGRLIEAVARMREPLLRDFQGRWVEFPVTA